MPLLAAKHALAPAAVADLFLGPTAWNRYTLDPRLPHYLQTLLDLRLVDLQSVLTALLRWSSAHALAPAALKEDEGRLNASGYIKSEAGVVVESKAGVAAGTDAAGLVRWENSFTSEEVIFYRLIKMVTLGSGIKDGKDALEITVVIAKWMLLFTAATAALPHEHEEDVMMSGLNAGVSASKKVREDVENSRAAFMLLLLGVCEYPLVQQALGMPHAKGRSSFFQFTLCVPVFRVCGRC